MDNLIILAQDPAVWAALITLIAMEVVLGIDNLIFISILTNKLPVEHRSKSRMIGILAGAHHAPRTPELRSLDREADSPRLQRLRS